LQAVPAYWPAWPTRHCLLAGWLAQVFRQTVLAVWYGWLARPAGRTGSWLAQLARLAVWLRRLARLAHLALFFD
jgi:hypothetical protein